MARVYGRAHAFWESVQYEKGDHPEWKLIFKEGWERKLRIGGYYAGYTSKAELLKALREQHAAQEFSGPPSAPGRFTYRLDQGDAAGESSARDDDVKTEERQKRRRTGGSPSTSNVPWEPVSGFAPSLSRKRDRETPAFPATHGSNRAKGNNFQIAPDSDEDDDHSVRNFVGDLRPENVADMYVLKCSDRVVPITNLPLCIDGTVSGGTGDQDIVLIGKFGGRTKSFPVDMWKLLLNAGSEPCLMVKTTSGSWLRLLKPLACYSKTVGDGYVLAHFLDFMKKTPSASVVDVEKHLARHCSMYRQEPFLDILSKHLRAIRSFVEGDEDLKRASVLRTFFPNHFVEDAADLRRNLSQQARQVFRSVLGLSEHTPEENETEMDGRKHDQMWVDGSSPGESSAEGYVRKETPTKREKKDKKLKKSRHPKPDQERPSKSKRKSSESSQSKGKTLDDPPICVLCDDGGDLLICDGPCSRYFHAFPGTGAESFCQTLSLSKKDTKGQRWYCKNCEHKQHQCFVCGELGSIDTALGRAEVYMCEVPSCKRFYHAHCVAELVDFPNWRSKASAIRNGTERLICPRHKCDTCRITDMTPGILVQCRRCPKAWHRACFTNYEASSELPTTTIWNHDQQEFVYCRQHKINPTLMTPDRDHVRFPEVVEESKTRKSRFKSSASSGTVLERQFCEMPPSTSLAEDMGLLDQ